MAFTLIEINKIQNGHVRPDDITLFELVVLMAKKHGQYTLNLTKDTSGNEDAANYKSKVNALSTRAINNDSSLFQNLLANIVINAGNTVNYADVKAYNNTDWETLVNNNLPTVFEMLSGATPAEISAWNNLPNS